MSKTLAAGDPVQVADREVAGPDAKSGLFYPHYRGLTGTLAKVYPDGTAAVTVSPESLPDEMRARHKAGSEAQRQKWLDGLSDEARNRLSAAEKQFSLRYTILVATTRPEPPPMPRRMRRSASAWPTGRRRGAASGRDRPQAKELTACCSS